MPEDVRSRLGEAKEAVECPGLSLAGQHEACTEKVGTRDPAPGRLIWSESRVGEAPLPVSFKRRWQDFPEGFCLFEGEGQSLPRAGVQIAGGVAKETEALGGTAPGPLLKRSDGPGAICGLRAGEALLQFREGSQQGGEKSLPLFGPLITAGLPENGDSDVLRSAWSNVCFKRGATVYLHEAAPGLDVEVLAYTEAGALCGWALEAGPLPGPGPESVCSDDQPARDRGMLLAGNDHAFIRMAQAAYADAFPEGDRRLGGRDCTEGVRKGGAPDSTSGAVLKIGSGPCAPGSPVGYALEGMGVLRRDERKRSNLG